MDGILEQIVFCVENGKINQRSPYPPAMKGQLGADEFTLQALEEGIAPSDVLSKGLIVGMGRIGVKFRENKVFVPQVLMSAKAMNGAMAHLKKYFVDGSIRRKGKLIIGTVEGDLHDIGKNLVGMIAEGNGYEVIDLGVDVPAGQFIDAIKTHPGAFVGMSALLTTTMANMEKINRMVKAGLATYQEYIDLPVADYVDPSQLLDYHSWPDPDRFDYAGSKALAKEARSWDFATIGPWISHFEIYCQMRGLENALMDTLANPDFLDAAVERIDAVQTVMLERMLYANDITMAKYPCMLWLYLFG